MIKYIKITHEIAEILNSALGGPCKPYWGCSWGNKRMGEILMSWPALSSPPRLSPGKICSFSWSEGPEKETRIPHVGGYFTVLLEKDEVVSTGYTGYKVYGGIMDTSVVILSRHYLESNDLESSLCLF